MPGKMGALPQLQRMETATVMVATAATIMQEDLFYVKVPESNLRKIKSRQPPKR